MDITLSTVGRVERDPDQADLRGVGIGVRAHRGVARVSIDPDTVLDVLVRRDMLVAPWTAPTYTAVLTITGGVVVQEGGLLCHAGIIGRELDIPPVIGCQGAMALIGNGDVVDVDPKRGEVHIVERAAASVG